MIPDTLILKILDGQGSSKDETELAEYLKDERNCEKMLFLMELESDLRSMSKINLVDSVMNDKRLGTKENSVSNSVMEEINHKKTNKKWFTLIGSMVASVAIIILLSLNTEETIGKVVLSSNGAIVIRENQVLNPKTFSDLKQGDIIQTKEDFSLAYEDNTLIDIGEKSIVQIQGTKEQKQLFLEKGSLNATVSPQEETAPFLVKTSKISVKVVGTKFSLNTTENSSDIKVEKGKVIVSDLSNKSYAIEAGQAMFVKNNKTRWLGHITEDAFRNARGHETKEFEFNDNKYGVIKPNEYFGKTFLSKDKTIDGFAYHSKTEPFSITEDSICNITFRTDCEIQFYITFNLGKKGEKGDKIFRVKRLDDKLINKWQTLSFSLRNKNNKYGSCNHLFIHTYSKERTSTYLEVGSIWLTTQ